MTISFTILTSRQTLEKQWKYLAKLGNRNIPFLKKSFRAFLVVLILFVAFCFLTSADNFIVLKAVIAYSIFIGYVIVCPLVLLIKIVRNNRRVKVILSNMGPDHLHYQVQVDDDGVKITYGEKTIPLLWSQLTRYGIYNNTLYLFNSGRALHSLFWDRDEMGSDNYLAITELIKQKSLTKMF